MSVIRLGSGGPWEAIVGYSRVVVRGRHRLGQRHARRSSTARWRTPGDAGAQTRQALPIVARRRWSGPGSPLADVVRTRMFVTDIAPLGGGRPGARRGLRRRPAGHLDGAGRRR